MVIAGFSRGSQPGRARPWHPELSGPSGSPFWQQCRAWARALIPKAAAWPGQKAHASLCHLCSFTSHGGSGVESRMRYPLLPSLDAVSVTTLIYGSQVSRDFRPPDLSSGPSLRTQLDTSSGSPKGPLRSLSPKSNLSPFSQTIPAWSPRHLGLMLGTPNRSVPGPLGAIFPSVLSSFQFSFNHLVKK